MTEFYFYAGFRYRRISIRQILVSKSQQKGLKTFCFVRFFLGFWNFRIFMFFKVFQGKSVFQFPFEQKILGNSRKSRKFQKTMKDSRKFQNTLENSRNLEKSRKFQKVQGIKETHRKFQKILGNPRKSQKVLETIRKSQEPKKYNKISTKELCINCVPGR